MNNYWKGRHLSEETKKKISEANKGQIPWNKGKHWSDEVKQRISKAQKGKKGSFYGKRHSKKVREQISKANKGKIPWNKGKYHSKETKEKISESLRGEKGSFYGQHHTEDSKRKMSKNARAWNRGKHLSEETKEKMAKARKDPKWKKKIGDKIREYYRKHPEAVERSIKNAYGIKCYSDDNIFHSSKQEKDCYDWIRKELKLKIVKFGRFDFLVNDKIVLEYHPCSCIGFLDKRNSKQYYKDRRKLLDILGHKDLALLVMISLNKTEKERIKNEIRNFVNI